jgi:hypothetical protein
MQRNAFITAAMLQRDGFGVDVRFVDGSIEVRLEGERATFPAGEAEKAADWLAACAVMNYPESAMARLWVMLAAVAGGAIPFGSR